MFIDKVISLRIPHMSKRDVEILAKFLSTSTTSYNESAEKGGVAVILYSTF